jgi:hypothetical protein
MYGMCLGFTRCNADASCVILYGAWGARAYCNIGAERVESQLAFCKIDIRDPQPDASVLKKKKKLPTQRFPTQRFQKNRTTRKPVSRSIDCRIVDGRDEKNMSLLAPEPSALTEL